MIADDEAWEDSMWAMVVPAYGGPEVFEMRQVPEPDPGPGEVQIQVSHIGVNFSDVRNRRGDGLGKPPFIPGIECSGTISKVGEGVSGLEVGDFVTAATMGHSYAEVVTCDARRVYPLPSHLVGSPVAAAIPGVVPTSLRLLRDAARAQAGETILVHGASGGVGTALVQVARVLELGPVHGTVSSSAKAEYAHRFGFTQVYLREGFESAVREATGGRGVDIVFDPMGGEVRARSFQAMAPFGRLIHFGNASLEPEVAPDAFTMRAYGWGYIGYSGAQHVFRDTEGTRWSYQQAIELVASGRVVIDVTRIYPLEEAAQAHRDIEAREAVGKLVLEVA